MAYAIQPVLQAASVLKLLCRSGTLPASLMRGTEAFAVIGMEEFLHDSLAAIAQISNETHMELNIVPEVWISI